MAPTPVLQTNGTVLTGPAGTRLAWRVFDPNVCGATICPVRYLHDYIEGTAVDTRYNVPTPPILSQFPPALPLRSQFPWYNPDHDVRIT